MCSTIDGDRWSSIGTTKLSGKVKNKSVDEEEEDQTSDYYDEETLDLNIWSSSSSSTLTTDDDVDCSLPQLRHKEPRHQPQQSQLPQVVQKQLQQQQEKQYVFSIQWEVICQLLETESRKSIILQSSTPSPTDESLTFTDYDESS